MNSIFGGDRAINKDDALCIARELQLEGSTSRPVFFHGRSMRPFLRDGDYLEVVSVCAEDIRVGDIVTYRDSDRFPTRRVAGFSPALGELLIKADYSPAKTFRVPVDDILGRAEARIRDGKRLVRNSLRWHWAAWSAPGRRQVLKIWRRRFRKR